MYSCVVMKNKSYWMIIHECKFIKSPARAVVSLYNIYYTIQRRPHSDICSNQPTTYTRGASVLDRINSLWIICFLVIGNSLSFIMRGIDKRIIDIWIRAETGIY